MKVREYESIVQRFEQQIRVGHRDQALPQVGNNLVTLVDIGLRCCQIRWKEPKAGMLKQD